MKLLLEQYVFAMPFLCGVIFSVLALVMIKWPPKEINVLYGYRTPSSMKNQQQWVFSQRFSARRMFEVGIVMLIASTLKTALPEDEMNEVYVGMTTLLGGCAYMIITTERALKKKFPKDA